MTEDEKLFLRSDEYYLFYQMMMQALKIDDVIDGVNKSLYLLKESLDSGNITLHKKIEENVYIHTISDLTMSQSVLPITRIINRISTIIEKKEIFKLNLDINEEYKNMMLIHLNVEESDYVLAISNYDSSKDIPMSFWVQLQETMQIILKRAESYERNIKAITMDMLTGLDNRNSYEQRVRHINEMDGPLIYGIFDLFRLKYINDNYSHALGDSYIKETAKILRKYWPSTQREIVGDTEKLMETGHKLYRIGGDEFVLLTTCEELEITKIKATLAAEEVAMLDLSIGDPVPLGLNVGIVEHKIGSPIKATYVDADGYMQEDKRLMYERHNLERRR